MSIFPSVNMLPMNDIKEELSLYFLTKTNKGDGTSVFIAGDTEKVNNIPSQFIAKAALDENGELAKDQDTVKNALNLGDKPASDYITKEEGNKIQNFGENVSALFADEITALRDELYQLRGELTRNGFVKEYGLYSGFQDFFNLENKKYIYSIDNQGDTLELCKLSPNFVNNTNVNKIIPSVSGLIKENDWFIISKTISGENYLVKATSVKPVGAEEEVTIFTPLSAAGIPSINNPSEVVITKVQGSYYNGTFSFSKIAVQALTGKENYTMLNDDTSTILKDIAGNKTGYAIGLRIPTGVGGALKNFNIMTRIHGTPGSISCYVLDSSKIASITNLDIEGIGENKAVLAKSLPLTYEAASTITVKELSFDFYNPDNYSYPTVVENKDYLFVIVCEAASAANYWSIQFSTNNIQTNIKTYTYKAGIGFAQNDSLGDILFILKTLQIKTDTETPYDEGLYSTQPIHIEYNHALARARLTLRINKEGLLKSKSNGLIADGGLLTLSSDSEINPENLGIKAGDTVIIGNDIRKANSNCTNNTFSIDKSIIAKENTEVYKVGYNVYLRAIKNKWNPATSSYAIESDKLLPMTLKAVMVDDHKFADNRSDRLIFECEFRDTNGNPIDANEFKLQIAWKSNLSAKQLITNTDYIGRIYDLTLSFDKTL